ncbi:MAG: spermidine/putrescine ABC transporter substrate-binding protein [Proteobacteria bacterium]|nr:spermidine/putrescine ABC transporter substrate-binding protein [Pseudomonadota bacterium]MBU1389793.1 spermidine/putrescine ABC transporter substrate-binding protein [Pseudomonadota bacterium]MBU1543802.1 spermidine/putrescine ABC transporter substrate-binding protein [Pseudomonadota bacterium]MBU2479578.1 spermidine/putrescine ABC transporter substrate-binding protein [Pseudomonadota bacterium]
MKKFILLMVIVLMCMSGAAWAGKGELKIFTWSEYMDEATFPQAFEKATGIKVSLDMYESNEEMMAKLQSGGIGQYDIIIPSDYIIPSLINLKLLTPLDHSKIPNLKNLSEKFTSPEFDPGNKFTAGYQWGTVGLMYNKKKLSQEDVQSWSILFDPSKKPGAFYLIDSVRDMLGIALLYLGYDFNSVNPKELKAAADLLVTTKKREACLGFKGGVGGKNDVISGVAAAAVVYNGDAIQTVSEHPDTYGFIVPKEGGTIWIDSMCIPAKAPNLDAAHQWINWVLIPENSAALSNYNHYASPNKAAIPFLVKEDLDNSGVWPTPEIIKTLRFVKDLGKDNKIIDQAWTRVKSH